MSDFTSLFEHYYKIDDVAEQAREARRIAWGCIENLLGSTVWSEILASDPAGWKEIEEEEYHSFDLDGIQVYARIDFAHSCGPPTIIDWKTGSPSPEDRRQLVLYALYSQFRWDWDPLKTRLIAAYLQPDLRVDEFTAEPDEIEAVRGEVKRSFDEMMELEPAFGPAKIDDFPKTEGAHICRWCRFQAACASG